MALAISDLSYDLLTLVRFHDRANNFAQADEYRDLLDRVNAQDQEYSDLLDELDEASSDRDEAERVVSINARLLGTIAGIARDALDQAEGREDIDDNEAALLDALASILSHAEA